MQKLADLSTTGDPSCPEGPMWPREGTLCGCWWAMREVELSTALCMQATFLGGPDCGQSASPAAEAETSCCEDVRHTSVWRPPRKGRGSRRTGDKIGICSRGVAWCGGSGSRHSSSCVETGQGGEEGFAVGRTDHTVRGFLDQSRLEALKAQQQQFVAAPPPPLDTESELRQLRETVAQLKGQLLKPAATSVFAGGKISFQIAWKKCRSGLEDVKPISTRHWLLGGQTRSRESATSCARQHNSGNEKYLLQFCHPW